MRGFFPPVKLCKRPSDTLYIAGGFGYHLNGDHAMAAGLMPTLSKERVRVIGNASLAGASALLQSDKPRPNRAPPKPLHHRRAESDRELRGPLHRLHAAT